MSAAIKKVLNLEFLMFIMNHGESDGGHAHSYLERVLTRIFVKI